MRFCLVSSSFYPAIFYGGPISATWDLSKKIGEKGVEVYVSTTNANGNEKLKNVNTEEHTQIAENVFIRYYNEQLINVFSFSFMCNIYSDIKKSDVVYILAAVPNLVPPVISAADIVWSLQQRI